MNIQELTEYALSKKGTSQDFPFDETSLCLRVGGKIFAIVSIDAIPLSVNLKCDPEKACDLRERYDSITPGYHMNKKHWNTVKMDGSLTLELIREMINDSYELIFNSLKKAEREKIINSD